MRSKRFNRTVELHRKIHELHKLGCSNKEIQAQLSVGPVTVWKHLKTDEIVAQPRRQQSLQNLAVARKMKAEGKSYREIGEVLGLTAPSVSELLHEGNPVGSVGVCVECGRERNDIVEHHEDYLNGIVKRVCRPCHMTLYHKEHLDKAKAARADARVDDRLAILTAMGWTEMQVRLLDNGRRHIVGKPPGRSKTIGAPNPLKDLNAMHEAEKSLRHDQTGCYLEKLGEVVGVDSIFQFDVTTATAPQRAEAFLATIGIQQKSL